MQFQIYNHVSECEQEILSPLRLQTTDFTGNFFSVGSGLNLRTYIERLINQYILSVGIEKFQDLVKGVVDDAMEVLENLSFLYSGLSRARDMDDVFLVIIDTVRFFTKKSLGKTIEDIFLWFSTQLELQSYDFAELRLLSSNYSAVKGSPLVTKVTKLSALAMSSCMMQSLGFTPKIEQLTEMYSKSLGAVVTELDFVAHLLDTTLYIVERLVQCWKLGSLQPFYHSSRSYAKWASDAATCIERSSLLHNPEANGFTYHGFLSDLDLCIETGIHIQKFSQAADEKDLVGSTLAKLRIIRGEILIRQAAGEERPSPFSILIAGGSGVGKSTFSRLLFGHFGKMFGLPEGSKGIYTRCSADQYWSGFKTQYWGILLDDIASVNPNKATDDATLTDLLQIINNVAFCPPQAELENKGKTPVRAEFCVGTTNTAHLNAAAWFCNPVAVRRRFPFLVKLKVKPAYVKDTAPDMLDPAKVPLPDSGDYSDIWLIELYSVDVVTVDDDGRQDTVETLVDKFDSIYAFMAHFSRLVRTFRVNQIKAAGVDKAISSVTLCPYCDLPNRHCACRSLMVQSGDVTNSTNYEVYTSVDSPVHLNWVEGLTALGLTAVAFRDDISQVSRAVSGAAVSYSRDYLIKYMRDLASKVVKDIVKDKRVWLFLTGCALAAAGYKMYHSFTEELKLQADHPTASDVRTIGVRPPSAGDESENFYHQKDDYRADMVVSEKSKSWRSLERTAVNKKISNSVVHLTMRREVNGETITRLGRAVCLGGRLYVTDNHVIPEGICEMTVTRECHAPGLTTNIVRLFDDRAAVRVPESELVFFQLLDSFDCPDITPLLAKEPLKVFCPGTLVDRGPDGVVATPQIPRLSRSANLMLTELQRPLNLWEYTLSVSTQVGLCGAPVVAHTPNGPVIVGLHVAGAGTRGAAVELLLSDVEKIRDKFLPTFSPAPPMLQSADRDVSLVPLHPKSVFRYIGHGIGRVFGQTTLPRAQPKTAVCPTLMRGAAVKRGYCVKTGAPVMRGKEIWRNSLMPIVEQTSLFSEHILNKCADAYVDEVCSSLTDDDFVELREPLDLPTAINGIPGRKFIDSINRSTSAGFPWCTTKKRVTKPLPSDEVWHDPITVNDEVISRMNEMIQRYDDGFLAAPVFIAHTKDEARSFKKIAEMNTRIMNGGPLDWSLIVRMYFLPIVRIIQKNPLLFEAMPGVVAQSDQWDKLYKHITKFGLDRMVAGDYGAFDKRMGAMLILLAFRVLIDIYKKAGMASHHIQRMWGIAYDIACSWCIYNGDLVQFLGSNPSGHPLTVIINCIVNSLYMRYCYYVLNPENEVISFRKFVALITYGDDNAFGSGRDWFNHSTISEVLRKHGVRYTMADKEAESVPFIHISNVTFLKRSWRYEPELDAMVCPIEEDTIHKMLTTWVPSSIGPEAHAAEILNNVCVEYFWYGREIFEKKREEMIEIFNECISPEYLLPNMFPTWDQLIDRWLLSSGRPPRAAAE